ncbi:MAG: metal ABC transporter substrate-binding protein, partial [Eubacteriales bacterium]|nr:metal ABC transporter substrate-binding protein [Eubacteriales bacterium]
MNYKKIIALMMTLLFMAGIFTACAELGDKQSEANGAAEDAATNTVQENGEKLKVVATIFPQYDFLREIAGDRIELTMLLTPGTEMHSYEPTPKDLIEITDSDLFVYVGGHSDTWVNKLKETRGDKPSLALVDMVNTYSEEIVEGMEHQHHEHEDEDHEHEDHDHEH